MPRYAQEIARFELERGRLRPVSLNPDLFQHGAMDGAVPRSLQCGWRGQRVGTKHAEHPAPPQLGWLATEVAFIPLLSVNGWGRVALGDDGDEKTSAGTFYGRLRESVVDSSCGGPGHKDGDHQMCSSAVVWYMLRIGFGR